MPKIRTTIEPDRLVEVDDKELSSLQFQGLILEVVDGKPTPPVLDPPAKGQKTTSDRVPAEGADK
jgi:hypothetical protein